MIACHDNSLRDLRPICIVVWVRFVNPWIDTVRVFGEIAGTNSSAVKDKYRDAMIASCVVSRKDCWHLLVFAKTFRTVCKVDLYVVGHFLALLRLVTALNFLTIIRCVGFVNRNLAIIFDVL